LALGLLCRKLGRVQPGRLRSEAGQTAAEYLGVLLVVSVIVGSIIASGVGGGVASAMDGAVCRIASAGCEEPAPATEEPGRSPTLSGGVDQPTSIQQQMQDAQDQQQQLLNSDDADEQMALQLQMQQLQEMIQLIQQIMQQQQEAATQIISNVR